jgi:hypothetical protein
MVVIIGYVAKFSCKNPLCMTQTQVLCTARTTPTPTPQHHANNVLGGAAGTVAGRWKAGVGLVPGR